VFVYINFLDVRFERFIKIFFSTMISIKNSFCAFLARVKIYTIQNSLDMYI